MNLCAVLTFSRDFRREHAKSLGSDVLTNAAEQLLQPKVPALVIPEYI